MSYDLITVNDGSADVNFERVSYTGNESIYNNVAALINLPHVMRLSRRIAKKPTGISDFLISIQRSVEDTGAEAFTARPGKTHVVFARPSDGVVTDAMMLADWTMLKAAIDANFASIINGRNLQ